VVDCMWERSEAGSGWEGNVEEVVQVAGVD